MVIEVTYNVTDVYMSTTVSPIYITVDYSGAGGSGLSVWGSITGTLSNQTDLQTALDGKFDDPTGTSLQYIDGTGAVQTFPLTLPVLQEVRNQTGSTLAAGTVVYINGATGNKPTVTKAIATGDSTSAQTLGMVSAAISNNGTGYVVVIGTCSGLDTSAFTEGQQLYLSGTTAGGVTITKPYAPIHLVYVGIVTRSHPTLGTIEVRVQNGYELDEIHDVDALSPSNNDGIFYNSGNSLWEHKPISTVLGYTPEQPLTFSSPLSRSTNTVSIPVASSSASGYLSSTDWSTFNSKQGALTLTTTGTSGAATLVGNTLNIPQYSGGGGMAIGGSITSATAGSVLFAGTSGVLAQDNSNLFWDSTNTRLGIGTNAPSSRFEVVAGSDANGIKLRGRSADNISNFFFSSNNGTSQYGYLQHRGGEMRIVNNVGDFVFYNGTTTLLTDTIGRWFTSGNLVIQTSGTPVDAGYKLDVNGTARIQGNLNTNLTTGSITFIGSTGNLGQDNSNLFWDNTNKRLGIGTNTPTEILQIRNSAAPTLSISSSTDTQSGNGRAAITLIRQGVGNPTGWDIIKETLDNLSFRQVSGGSASEKIRFYTNGNVLIQNGGTFTDSGERLQVTGGGSFTSNVKTTINLAATNGFISTNNNSAGVATVDVVNNLSTIGFFRAYGSSFGTSPYSELSDIVGFGSSKSIKIFSDASLGSGGTSSIQFMAGGYYDNQERVRIGTYGMLIGTKTSTASAILNVTSTTQGFLPPRMTTTQKNAISSPAAGLVVYDTTLNKLCVYTTAWETITSI